MKTKTIKARISFVAVIAALVILSIAAVFAVGYRAPAAEKTRDALPVATLTFEDTDLKTVNGIDTSADDFDPTLPYQVVIPDTVLRIAPLAFEGQTNLTRVVFAADGLLEEIGEHAFAQTGLTEVELPSSVKKVGLGAFVGTTSLETLIFAHGSGLNEIGDFAFSGTGITAVTIPGSVTVIGAGAFSDCDALTTVTLPNNLESIKKNAFGGNAKLTNIVLPETFDPSVFEDGEIAGAGTYLIAKNRAHYDALLKADNVPSNLTYEVKISYNYRGTVIDEETRLYGYGYTVVKDHNGDWVSSDVDTVGTSVVTAYNTRWFKTLDDVSEDNVIDKVDELSDLINTADGDEIVLYAYEHDGKMFIARDDIVFDPDKTYGTDQLNSLLSVASDKIESGMTAVIESYTDANGEQQTGVTQVHDAGTYIIKVTADGTTYPLTIKVARKVADLGDYTNVLAWRLTSVDGAATDSELRNREGVQLYIYTETATGKHYPTRNALTESELNSLGLEPTFTQKTVRYSVVRKRADNIVDGQVVPVAVKVEIAGGLNGEAYEVEVCAGNTGSDIGVYTASATVTANNNYILDVSSVTDGAARGIDIQLAADGKSATVTKVWYIVDIGNWLVFGGSGSNSGKEYNITDREYGDADAVEIPRLMYGDVDESLYGDETDPVSLTLYRNNERIGSATFTRDEFYDYITDCMPAGNYRLEVRIGAVTSTVYADDDVDMTNPQTLYHSACDETVEFTVGKKALPEVLINELYSALNGNTFYHEWTGAANYYDAATKTVVDKILSSVANPSRTNTIWERYGNLYGSFGIMYNLARMQSDEYLAPAYMDIAPTDPDLYTVYYKVYAPNYYDTLESITADKTRADYSFYVVNIKSIAIPTVADMVYTGALQTAALADTVEYEVYLNDGGINVGEYTVTLRFRQPDYYMWQDQTILDKTSTKEITYNIIQATNRWETLPDIARWSEGEYNAKDNAVIGKARFGTAVIVITDDNDKIVYNSATGVNELKSLKAGTYKLSATVTGNANYEGLTYATFLKVFEKPGLPWWAILLIVIGALGVAALIVFILYKKGVFQLLTGKLVIAIRTKATVEATIASVRASKIAAEAKVSVAEAEAKDAAEERAAARKRAAAAARAKTTEERAAALEEKAKAATERAERMLARAQAMQARADAMKDRALDDKAQSIEVVVADQSEVDKFDTEKNEDVKPIEVTTDTPEATVESVEVQAEQPPVEDGTATEQTSEPAAEPVDNNDDHTDSESEQKPAAKKPTAKKSTAKKKPQPQDNAEAAATDDDNK